MSSLLFVIDFPLFEKTWKLSQVDKGHVQYRDEKDTPLQIHNKLFRGITYSKIYDSRIRAHYDNLQHIVNRFYPGHVPARTQIRSEKKEADQITTSLFYIVLIFWRVRDVYVQERLS